MTTDINGFFTASKLDKHSAKALAQTGELQWVRYVEGRVGTIDTLESHFNILSRRQIHSRSSMPSWLWKGVAGLRFASNQLTITRSISVI
jgi:hypothetical protein